MTKAEKKRIKRKWIFRACVSICITFAAILFTLTFLLPSGVSASVSSFLGISVDKTVSYQIHIDGTSEVPKFIEFNGYVLENGIWYDPYTRVFSVGGDKRVVEVSNYPRAYKDTIAHVYEKDKKFEVTEDDLTDHDAEGIRCYWDRRLEKAFYLKDTATHYAGEPLPGCFPRWLQYDTIQPVTKEGIISLVKVPSPFTITSQVKSLDDKTAVKTEDSTVSKDKELTVSEGALIVYFEAKRP